MKSLINTRFLAAAALAMGAFGAASAAHARSDVFLSIGLQGTPGVYVQPAPVYVQPQPVYVQPRYGYATPAVVYDRGYDRDYDRGYSSHHRYDDRGRHHGRRFGPWGDIDRDGVANRYDRAPQNPYRY